MHVGTPKGEFKPLEKLEWTAETEVERIKELVQEREKVFERARRLRNPTLEAQSLSELKRLSEEDPILGSTFRRYREFCQAVEIPPFPVTLECIALFIFAKRSCQDGYYYSTMLYIKRVRNETHHLWKQVMLSSDADVEMEATLKEFIQERSSVRVKGRGGVNKPTRLATARSESSSSDESFEGSVSRSPSNLGRRSRTPASDRSFGDLWDTDTDSQSASPRRRTLRGLIAAPEQRWKDSTRATTVQAQAQAKIDAANVEQFPTPGLPRFGDLFTTAEELLIKCYMAMLPIYGNGVDLARLRHGRVHIKCYRNRQRGGYCPWKFEAAPERSASGEHGFVVQREGAFLLHNHGRHPNIVADPRWRPKVRNEVVWEAFQSAPNLHHTKVHNDTSQSELQSCSDYATRSPSKKRKISNESPSYTAPRQPPLPHSPAGDLPSTSRTSVQQPHTVSYHLAPPSFRHPQPLPSSTEFLPQLGFFLQSLHPSLRQLDRPLFDSGITSVDTLALLCHFESSTLDKFIQALRQNALDSGQTISVIHLKLLQRQLSQAKLDGFKE